MFTRVCGCKVLDGSDAPVVAGAAKSGDIWEPCRSTHAQSPPAPIHTDGPKEGTTIKIRSAAHWDDPYVPSSANLATRQYVNNLGRHLGIDNAGELTEVTKEQLAWMKIQARVDMARLEAVNRNAPWGSPAQPMPPAKPHYCLRIYLGSHTKQPWWKITGYPDKTTGAHAASGAAINFMRRFVGFYGRSWR